MRSYISAFLATAPVALASQTVFSVHDDLQAFPQYEVIFSDSLISTTEASLIIDSAQSTIHDPQASPTDSLSPRETTDPIPNTPSHDPSHETYEYLYLHNKRHLCSVPIVHVPPKNETSAAAARLAEQKELARATDKGWELLQELEGNCLYFVSGWWSYSFCYNNEITQFHQLPPQPGKPLIPPQKDPSTKEFVLGKAHVEEKQTKGKQQDEWGNEIDVRKSKGAESPKTELQVKGDSRYLVQKMDGGTTCDLTGKPRRVEVQFHCNPHVTDRIGYIKEVTTCSYLLVVYTPRLCTDVAFMPHKETKANPITCRLVVPESEFASLHQKIQLLDSQSPDESTKAAPTIIGGLELGGGKWINKAQGQKIAIPENFAKPQAQPGKQVEVIATAQSKAEGGKVTMMDEAKMKKLDLDPEIVEQLKREVEKMAREKGWRIEVVDAPGQVREILGIVNDEDDGDYGEGGEEGEGSEEEFYKDEL